MTNPTAQRDSARTYEAYSQRITNLNVDTQEIQEELTQGACARPESMRNLIFINHLEVAKIMYCRGDAFEAIHQPIIDGVEYVLNFDDKSNLGAVYVVWLEYAALSILLKMPESIFRDMKLIIDRHDERDQVLDHLLSSRIKYEEREASPSGFMGDNNLNRAIDCCHSGGSDCERHLSNFLNDEWHNGLTIMPSTKHRGNPELPYDGIYCFPVAAMAYINKLDDTDLRKSEYYPSDIADYVRL